VAGSVESTDVAARDDAHLRSLGIKPELARTLGFLSVFAVAFSYISVSTGTFTNQAVAFGVGGPAVFWAWPLVILGQTFVALNFAELASHFPVAGSIYQWSKRLSNKTLGWFTGWIYFWAGVITVTAVAVTVPLVLSTIPQTAFVLSDPSPVPGLDMQSFIGLVALVTTTVINILGVRLLAIINNIGVAAEILGSMAVMIAATACCGIAAGLGYRGSLQVVNQIAPQDRRAEVVSSYFVCAFLGNALPVIGVGVISTLASSTAASLVFAATISAFALVALFFGIKYRK